jgi:hypothetical protein
MPNRYLDISTAQGLRPQQGHSQHSFLLLAIWKEQAPKKAAARFVSSLITKVFTLPGDMAEQGDILAQRCIVRVARSIRSGISVY